MELSDTVTTADDMFTVATRQMGLNLERLDNELTALLAAAVRGALRDKIAVPTVIKIDSRQVRTTEGQEAIAKIASAMSRFVELGYAYARPDGLTWDWAPVMSGALGELVEAAK